VAIANGKIPPPPPIRKDTGSEASGMDSLGCGGRKISGRDKRPRTDREATVLHDCLRYLKKRGIFAYRQNTGTLWTNGQPVSFGYPGSADITGILPDGRRLEVECKSATGKQSSKQKQFEEKIRASGGVYILTRSVEDLERGLECEH
jgi:hypothetical protein